MRRLQDRGIIHHFAAVAAPAVLAPVSAFVGVSLANPEQHLAFQREVEQLEQVQECHQLAGEHDYLLKVRCASLAQLGDLLSSVLPRLVSGRISSTVVVSTVKESTVLPLPVGEDS